MTVQNAELDDLVPGAGGLAAALRTAAGRSPLTVRVDASLAESRTSADAAAALAREASGTLTALATAMSLSIFGAQPLLPLPRPPVHLRP